MRTPQTKQIIHKELSYKIVGCLYKTHDELGRYAREKQYGDLLANILMQYGLLYEREKLVSKTGKDVNKVDFIIENSIILELKTKPFIEKSDYYQIRRYLEIMNLKLGLLVNFRQKYLSPKRILNPKVSS